MNELCSSLSCPKVSRDGRLKLSTRKRHDHITDAELRHCPVISIIYLLQLESLCKRFDNTPTMLTSAMEGCAVK
jgi:hypothetical protein